MASDMNRRDFIKGSLAATAGGAILGAAGAQAAETKPAAQAPEIKPVETLPHGKIGKLQMSRLIMGSNLITYYVHARDLKFVNNLTRHYNNEAKILETLAIAEQHGVNTIMTQDDPKYWDILRKYRNELGGKLQWIVAPSITDPFSDFQARVRSLVIDGVSAMYIHGNQGDPFCAQGKRDLLAAAIEEIKMNGIPAGVGGHDLNVVKYCEANKIENDFYVKTFHHHNYPTAPKPEQVTKPYSEIPGYWCHDPVETAKVFKDVKKPWIAFKVMAAGAIPPESAFKYVYQHGADFVLAGMFDFEIADDVKIAREAIASAAKRERPWQA